MGEKENDERSSKRSHIQINLRSFSSNLQLNSMLLSNSNWVNDTFRTPFSNTHLHVYLDLFHIQFFFSFYSKSYLSFGSIQFNVEVKIFKKYITFIIKRSVFLLQDILMLKFNFIPYHSS
jgi:hypothetical protein